jgi:hypothetical protein
MLKARIVTIGVVMLALIATGLGCSSATTRTDVTTGPSGDAQADPVDRVVAARNAIESAYPEFTNFEEQESFAGRTVKSEADDGDYYFAYIVLGSGLPIAKATCFRVDRTDRVFKVGLFPDPVDSYAGYRDVNPRNCKGIK